MSLFPTRETEFIRYVPHAKQKTDANFQISYSLFLIILPFHCTSSLSMVETTALSNLRISSHNGLL